MKEKTLTRTLVELALHSWMEKFKITPSDYEKAREQAMVKVGSIYGKYCESAELPACYERFMAHLKGILKGELQAEGK